MEHVRGFSVMHREPSVAEKTEIATLMIPPIRIFAYSLILK